MKLLQQSLLLLLFIISISCNSSKEENPVNIELNSSDFDIELVGDKTQFNEQSIIIKKLSLENNISITGVDWYIDNVIYSESNQSSIKFAFDLFGDINVKAHIYLDNNQMIVVNKQFKIIEKEYSAVGILAVTVTGLEWHILNDYSYTSNYGNTLISLQSKFTVSDIDDNTIYFISEKNFVNNRTRDFEDIEWTGPNLALKIYSDGIPDNKLDFTFYGQNIELGRSEAIMSSHTLSLNDYRFVKPTEVEFTSHGLTYKLTLHWF